MNDLRKEEIEKQSEEMEFERGKEAKRDRMNESSRCVFTSFFKGRRGGGGKPLPLSKALGSGRSKKSGQNRIEQSREELTRSIDHWQQQMKTKKSSNNNNNKDDDDNDNNDKHKSNKDKKNTTTSNNNNRMNSHDNDKSKENRATVNTDTITIVTCTVIVLIVILIMKDHYNSVGYREST